VDDLLAAGIDGVVIAAATDVHPELILASLAAGLPTFCEKPVSKDPGHSAEILRRTQAGDVPVQIGYPRRFDAAFAEARRAVAAGELGFLHTVRSTTLDPAPPPDGYVKASGGIFRDCSVHDFDAVRWVTGQEVVEVYALGANRGASFFRDAGDVDTAAALLTLADGGFAHVAATRYNAAGYDVRLEVLGSEQSISVGLDDRLPLHSTEPGVTFPAGTPYPMFMDRFHAAYVAELTGFTDIVAGRAEPSCTVADALEAFLIAEACELSRAAHRPVLVDEVRT
jgi:myo-inositol 2-dehydrogenase/D-chiro-inositol 1-dehydrogenase